MITTVMLDMALGLLAAIIVAGFSRQREFRADRGAAAMMGDAGPMQTALARLGGLQPGELPKAVADMGISSKSGGMRLFSSHPPIEERIEALRVRRQPLLESLAVRSTDKQQWALVAHCCLCVPTPHHRNTRYDP